MKKFRKPKKFDVSAVVIGAGAAGLVSSIIFAGGRGKVVLIEQGKMGGDCLNTGCIPSKTLIRASRLMFDISHASEFNSSPKFSSPRSFTFGFLPVAISNLSNPIRIVCPLWLASK